MSVGVLDNPKYWHSRAAEARVVAEALTDEDAKNLMLGVAQDYELIAQRAASRRNLAGAHNSMCRNASIRYFRTRASGDCYQAESVSK